ncbi:Asp23/Gls24 family envelope stress response protein [Umezawaea sp. Da 62-37]|uniref:Asp23/Gls24 family envelope stress response protein n=1 Tax=Umezawaea sp. Da 62-37 TaxID=3075927 RepID=UPI0028F73AA9|nr:Asp23/Gls24 family envelope stress response protein [Umezawaea sp. Da 62-37]WNV88443.1 Asp23/Gls24 family envelope stress response protein [Umezawaea sp. Da 62-37]
MTAEHVISKPVVAAVAAHAARGVVGVSRLEPGLAGLVGSVARTARQRFKGLDPAPTEGVRVHVDVRVWLEVDVVTSADDQAAAVGRAVQRAVARAVTNATGLAVAEVAVSVLEIELS